MMGRNLKVQGGIVNELGSLLTGFGFAGGMGGAGLGFGL